jgi:branched-chain amino acid transport system substrate-binding protein
MAKKYGMVILAFAFFFTAFQFWAAPSMAAEPYVIGYVADITGMARANYAPEAEGTRLYIDYLNAKGGINGHPVKLVIEDGRSEPAKSAAVAKKLIVEDKALALMGLGFSRAQPPVMELAKKDGVAVVAGYTLISPAHKTQPGDVGFATGYIMHPKFHPGGYGYARVAAELHPKGRIANSAYDTPGGRFWSQWAADWAKKMGLDVVYHEDVPPGTVDLSPWATKVAKADPDMFVIAVGGEIFIPLATALEKSGWTKDLMFPDFVAEGDFVKGIKRLMTNGEWILWFGRYASAFEKIPEYDRIREAMKKFGHQYPLSARHAQGWTMGRLIEQALKKAGWPCTRAKVIAALEQTNLDTKGLSGGPIRFTPTDHYGPTWWKVSRWNATKKALVPVTGWVKIEPSEIARQ